METTNDVPKFNDEGCLPFKIYEMSISEFEELFSKGKSNKRQYIMEQYKYYLKNLLDSEYVLHHWADGSFVTLKDEPNDIDLLTEIDGLKMDLDDQTDEIHKLIEDASLWTENLCHSLGVYKYPESEEFEVEYNSYINTDNKRCGIKFFDEELGKSRKISSINFREGLKLKVKEKVDSKVNITLEKTTKTNVGNENMNPIYELIEIQ